MKEKKEMKKGGYVHLAQSRGTPPPKMPSKLNSKIKETSSFCQPFDISRFLSSLLFSKGFVDRGGFVKGLCIDIYVCERVFVCK